MRIALARLPAVVTVGAIVLATAFLRRGPSSPDLLIQTARGWKSPDVSATVEENRNEVQPGSFVAQPPMTEFVTPATDSRCALVSPQNCQTIHVAIRCIGNNDTQSTAQLIKSILMYRRNPLHFHLLVDSMSDATLKELFRTWKLIGVEQSYYWSKIAQVLERKSESDSKTVKHEEAVNDWLLQALPESLTKVIVLDARRVFASDISELWSFFDEFSDTQGIGGVKQGSVLKPGLMLVDLAKIRELSGYQLHGGPIAAAAGPAADSRNPLHMSAPGREELVFELPCVWNYLLTDSASTCDVGEEGIKVAEVSTSWLPKQFWKLLLKVAHFDGNMLRRPLAFTCFPSDVPSSGSTTSANRQFRLVETYGDSLCKDYMREIIDVFRTHTFYLEYEYNPPKDTLDITLVTQLSIGRIQGFEGICSKWPGPISVAVYIADCDVRHFVTYLLDSKVLSKRKNIGYHFVYEEGSLYPTNHLRNVALKQVQTTHVFLLDVDFIPQPDLYERLKRTLQNPKLTTGKLALLVPAFETQDYSFKFPQNKSQAVAQYDSGTIFGFRTNVFLKGHGATNFARWRNTSEPYEIKWEDGFEPYIVMRTTGAPSYNEIFMGYGKDKISQIMEVTAMGNTFLVLPDTYIIHLPHAVSFDSQRFREDSSILKCMSLLLDDFTRGLLHKHGANALGGLTPKPLPPRSRPS